jgi:hypothetical protein
LPAGFTSYNDRDFLKPDHGVIDGIYMDIIWKKGNVYSVNIGSKLCYLVTDGKGKYSHGDTVQLAKEGLLYKISNRDKSSFKNSFKNLKLDSVLTFEECIEFYRVITGACDFGVKNFIENNSIEQKNYTVQEILTKTKGQYGHQYLVSFLNL